MTAHADCAGPSSATPVESAERFVSAMASAATAVSVVTTDGKFGRFGMTVSAITSVSVEPPLVLACINRRSPLPDAIEANGVMAVNLLGEGQQHIADVFAGRSSEARYDFGCAKWFEGVTGSPLLRGVAALFDCELDAIHDAGSHRILIGRVVEARCGEALPLVYARHGYRGIADIDMQGKSTR